MVHRFIVLSAALLCLAACGSESPSPTQPTPPLEHGSMSAKVDGRDWTATVGLQANYQSGVLAFAGGNSDGSIIAIGLVPSSGPGTYTVSVPMPTNASYTMPGGTAAVWQAVAGVGGSGTVTLTSLTTTGASGTFSFELPPVASTAATGTKSITQGKFALTF
ncbi:MAG TPA: DUF6252 family protein [Gemmatimonadaceae bacterium]|nr:DUF6252 family protein [Gemmatimonadaceae bacterium]